MLEGTKDKLQKICEVLKKETLEPAKQEAKEIVENARLQREKIISQSEEEAKKILEEADKNFTEKKKIFDSNLKLASRQVIDELKQIIEEKLLSPLIGQLITGSFSSKEVESKLVAAVLEALNREGFDGDFAIYLAKNVSAKEVSDLLSKELFSKLKEGSLSIGDNECGIKVQLKKEKITIDISEESLKELLSRYVKEDLREVIFQV